ncbi:MAG: tRNA 4-thiouridine(8) synthase ThiI [Thermodesulfobacteriota bacterium]
MNSATRKVRALGLCSGGLDSILSALVLRRQGIDVAWVAFETPFFSAEKARKAARMCKVPLTVRDITSTYLEMLKKPACGYGKYMNPCMDCHALMFRLAGEIMTAEGFDFLFSGEVLGQRPMSQTMPSLRYVEKHSGWRGRILRPLSAKRLAPTAMETDGLVDREQLLDLSGRGRKPQIQLAAEMGVSEYPAPAGGCLLTDKGHSRRLRDLFDHQPEYSVNELHLLKFGRHLRLGPATRIIVGRTQFDNQKIVDHHDPRAHMLVKVCDHPGPVTLVPLDIDDELLHRAAAVCAGYAKTPAGVEVTVRCESAAGVRILAVRPLAPAAVTEWMI